MKHLKNIDVAFLQMNLPYTRTPDRIAGATKTFRPKIPYPFHRGETDPAKLIVLLQNIPDIEIRIRQMT
jgi:hypothetical protein